MLTICLIAAVSKRCVAVNFYLSLCIILRDQQFDPYYFLCLLSATIQTRQWM